MRAVLQRIDPLVWFLVLGGLLAWIHHATRDDAVEPTRDNQIVVTDADVAWIVRAFEKTWQRQPTPDEVRTLVDRRVRDEILFREARALGLDQGDDTLRRRLAMKLEFLAKDLAAAEPGDGDVEAYFQANAARYARPGQRTFRHVYVSEDEHGAKARDVAEALLAKLAADPLQDVATLGDRIMLEAEQRMLTLRDVAALFGESFAKAVFELEPDAWSGPLRSGYGLHLVLVVEDRPGAMPPLAEVRDRVRADLIDTRRDAGLEVYVESLRAKYDVRIDAELPEGTGE